MQRINAGKPTFAGIAALRCRAHDSALMAAPTAAWQTSASSRRRTARESAPQGRAGAATEALRHLARYGVPGVPQGRTHPRMSGAVRGRCRRPKPGPGWHRPQPCADARRRSSAERRHAAAAATASLPRHRAATGIGGADALAEPELRPLEFQAHKALRLVGAQVLQRAGGAGARRRLQEQRDAVAVAQLHLLVLGHPAPPRLPQLLQVQAVGGEAGNGRQRERRRSEPCRGVRTSAAPSESRAGIFGRPAKGQRRHVHGVLGLWLGRLAGHLQHKHVPADEAANWLGGLPRLRRQLEVLWDLVSQLLPPKDQTHHAFNAGTQGAVHGGGRRSRNRPQFLGGERRQLDCPCRSVLGDQLQSQQRRGLLRVCQCFDSPNARGGVASRRLEARHLRRWPHGRPSWGGQTLLAPVRVDRDGEVQLRHQPCELL
mmetsp:Transcript_75731/g.239486  ORF Transcript_75731/g.239486 Transcript_75731/m.239486 type:complete len:430 (+) Transcript_75731:36-1325(+)